MEGRMRVKIHLIGVPEEKGYSREEKQYFRRKC